MNARVVKSGSRRYVWSLAGVLLLVLAVAVAALARRWRHLPPGMMLDIRAGVAARAIPDADQRFLKYLEGRYGSQADPDNRRKAFLDFFNVDHVKALQLLVKHSPEKMRQANIEATARWLEHYRNSLSPEDRAGLVAYFNSPEGLASVRAATAAYNSQDVEYRGQTIPVISQLLGAIGALQHH
jgi:hypothetical protein